MAKLRKPLYDWYVLVVAIVVLVVIVVVVWLLLTSFRRTLYIEEKHEAPLPTDTPTPYESGAMAD